MSFYDGHKSKFLLSKLKVWKEGTEEERLVQTSSHRVPEPVFWNASHTVKTFRRSDLDDRMQVELIETLLRDGIALVREAGITSGECSRISNLISTLRSTEWGNIFSVKSGYNDESDIETKKDLAYSTNAIPLHTDNPYRGNGMPDFQLLHAIEHCECENDEGLGCDACGVYNTFSDGFHAADALKRNSPMLFAQLATTKVRFENDGGGNKSALYASFPIIETSAQTGRVSAIRYSPKSGMYTPTDATNSFYDARRAFASLIKHEKFIIKLQLRRGDIIIFDNKRILHSRTSAGKADGKRWLEGCYLNRDGLLFNLERLKRHKGTLSPSLIFVRSIKGQRLTMI